VRAELALVDEALLRLVHELDRILDREDVAVLVRVHVIDHRRERRRLARARRAGAQDEAARPVRHLGEHLRRVQFLERQDLRRHGPERGGRAARLHERVDPEAARFGTAKLKSHSRFSS
jgi:hypothetical protein